MFGRINRAVLRYLERRRDAPRIEAVELTPEGFAVAFAPQDDEPPTHSRYIWWDVRLAAAMLVPGLPGGDKCLLLECADDSLQLTGDVKGLDVFIGTCERRFAGWVPATEWRIKLAAQPAGTTIELYWRDAPA